MKSDLEPGRSIAAGHVEKTQTFRYAREVFGFDRLPLRNAMRA
jgi:hypothetical protein